MQRDARDPRHQRAPLLPRELGATRFALAVCLRLCLLEQCERLRELALALQAVAEVELGTELRIEAQARFELRTGGVNTSRIDQRPPFIEQGSCCGSVLWTDIA